MSLQNQIQRKLKMLQNGRNMGEEEFDAARQMLSTYWRIIGEEANGIYIVWLFLVQQAVFCHCFASLDTCCVQHSRHRRAVRTFCHLVWMFHKHSCAGYGALMIMALGG